MKIQWDNIPLELREHPHWVLWRLETRDDKPTKVPYNAATAGRAKSNESATWNTLAKVRAVFEHRKSNFDGIGFMLGEGCGIAGVDLDHAVDVQTGELHAWAGAIVEELGTYAEVSPSGAGLRLWGRGALPPGRRKKGDIEMYDRVRFLTVTGNVWAPCDGALPDISEALALLHARVFPPETKTAGAGAQPGAASLDDRELLGKMFGAKNGERAAALYAGAWSHYYNSQSEADSALCFHLAFWAARDPFVVDRVFRGSGLMREKWDEKHGQSTYGEMTVLGACEKVQDTYTAPIVPSNLIRSSRDARAHIRGEATAETSAPPETPSPEEADDEEEAPPTATDDADEAAVNEGVYAIQNGRTVFAAQKVKQDALGSQTSGSKHFVADFAAFIAGEVRDESCVAFYQIEGRTRTKQPFSVELDAGKMSDARFVAGAFLNATGAGTIIYAGMEKHLAPSLHQFTDRKKLKRERRFNRTGWTRDGKRFLIPGLEERDTTIALPSKLAYRVPVAQALSDEAKGAFKSLVRAQKPSATMVALSTLLAAPMALSCNWRDERYALFIAGRTGSFKSSWAAVAKCIYGDFLNEDKLLKFGQGATNNALMQFMATAGDLPLLIDNYKPSTGDGARGLTNLIHAALEGGEKERLTRDSKLRDARDIHCWPVFTGEDIVDDAAALARCLVLTFDWDNTVDNVHLTAAQGAAHHLNEIGGVLICWLQTDAGRRAQSDIQPIWQSKRAAWAARLRKERADMVNINRVASNLAVCECAMSVALECPALAEVLAPWTPEFLQGLSDCAHAMSNHTAQSHEANRYIEALRALLSANKAFLLPTTSSPSDNDRRDFLGWEDDSGTYLIPDMAYHCAQKLGSNLGGITKNAIHKQLGQLGFLMSANDGRATKVKRLGALSGLERVLHLRADILGESAEDDE